MKLKEFRRLLPSFLNIIGFSVVIAALFFVWSYVTYGDIRSGWLRIAGYHLIAEQYQLDLGIVQAGKSKTVVFRLKNLTDSPIIILGTELDCSCLAPVELPVTIPSGEAFDLNVNFFTASVDSPTEVFHRIILVLSVDQPMKLLEFKAKIIP